MKHKYSLLSLAAGTALLFAAGCGKQESSTSTASDNATKAPAPAVGEKPAVVEAAKPVVGQPVAAVKVEPVAASNSLAAAIAPELGGPGPAAALVTNSASSHTQRVATGHSVAAAALAARGATNATPASAGQSTSLLRRLASTSGATNEMQALAAGATNQTLSALSLTNQSAVTGTNQVEILLERAKVLSANQKYQDALATVTQVYQNKLTPDQKLKADDLTTQIKSNLTAKAMSGASSALGNFLGGKK